MRIDTSFICVFIDSLRLLFVIFPQSFTYIIEQLCRHI